MRRFNQDKWLLSNVEHGFYKKIHLKEFRWLYPPSNHPHSFLFLSEWNAQLLPLHDLFLKYQFRLPDQSKTLKIVSDIYEEFDFKKGTVLDYKNTIIKEKDNMHQYFNIDASVWDELDSLDLFCAKLHRENFDKRDILGIFLIHISVSMENKLLSIMHHFYDHTHVSMPWDRVDDTGIEYAQYINYLNDMIMTLIGLIFLNQKLYKFIKKNKDWDINYTLDNKLFKGEVESSGREQIRMLQFMATKAFRDMLIIDALPELYLRGSYQKEDTNNLVSVNNLNLTMERRVMYSNYYTQDIVEYIETYYPLFIHETFFLNEFEANTLLTNHLTTQAIHLLRNDKALNPTFVRQTAQFKRDCKGEYLNDFHYESKRNFLQLRLLWLIHTYLEVNDDYRQFTSIKGSRDAISNFSRQDYQRITF